MSPLLACVLPLVAFAVLLPLAAEAQDPYAGQPLGQCLADGDCASGSTCTESAPGGICAGCASDLDGVGAGVLATSLLVLLSSSYWRSRVAEARD